MPARSIREEHLFTSSLTLRKLASKLRTTLRLATFMLLQLTMLKALEVEQTIALMAGARLARFTCEPLLSLCQSEQMLIAGQQLQLRIGRSQRCSKDGQRDQEQNRTPRHLLCHCWRWRQCFHQNQRWLRFASDDQLPVSPSLLIASLWLDETDCCRTIIRCPNHQHGFRITSALLSHLTGSMSSWFRRST